MLPFAVLMCTKMVPAPPPSNGDQQTLEPLVNGPKSAPTQSAPAFKEILKLPGVAGYAIAYFFLKLMRYVLLFWLPVYYTTELHVSVAWAALVSSLMEVGSAAGIMLLGGVMDRLVLPAHRGMAYVWMAWASGTLLMLLLLLAQHHVLLNVMFMFGIGAFSAALEIALSANCGSDVSRENGYGELLVGTVTGVIVATGSLGAVMQGALVSTAVPAVGWGGLLHILALLCWASGAALVPYATTVASRRRVSDIDPDSRKNPDVLVSDDVPMGSNVHSKVIEVGQKFLFSLFEWTQPQLLSLFLGCGGVGLMSLITVATSFYSSE